MRKFRFFLASQNGRLDSDVVDDVQINKAHFECFFNEEHASSDVVDNSTDKVPSTACTSDVVSGEDFATKRRRLQATPAVPQTNLSVRRRDIQSASSSKRLRSALTRLDGDRDSYVGVKISCNSVVRSSDCITPLSKAPHSEMIRNDEEVIPSSSFDNAFIRRS